jgi:hypothetical protein
MTVKQIDRLRVYTMQGGETQVPVIEIQGGGKQLLLDGLSSGLYFVEIQSGSLTTTVKLVKP